MEVLYPRCAGLDVHSRRVNGCVRVAAGRKATTAHREFATTTAGLLEPLVLANAQHVRNVPGRKSDRSDAAWIADLLAHGLIRGSFVPPTPIQELRDLTRTAVHGRVTSHHRFLLKLHLAQIDALTAAVQQVEHQADEVLRPFREAADRLTTRPGVSETVARVIISEIGVDMTRFPSAGHLVSWAGLCPRLDESAGKRRSTRLRHATPWLKTALVQAAWAATRKKESYLQAQYRRLKGRRGPKKAIVAVAASMLTAIYFMLRDETDYHDLGGRYLADRDKHRVTQHLLRRLHNLGVEVEVKPA